ncbi:hypothetical protein Vi05172_g1955 [Venturia inaequalis]|nr:hypothetical protein Vi05172_g1955 [Venturia inaequalis]
MPWPGRFGSTSTHAEKATRAGEGRGRGRGRRGGLGRTSDFSPQLRADGMSAYALAICPWRCLCASLDPFQGVCNISSYASDSLSESSPNVQFKPNIGGPTIAAKLPQTRYAWCNACAKPPFELHPTPESTLGVSYGGSQEAFTGLSA